MPEPAEPPKEPPFWPEDAELPEKPELPDEPLLPSLLPEEPLLVDVTVLPPFLPEELVLAEACKNVFCQTMSKSEMHCTPKHGRHHCDKHLSVCGLFLGFSVLT